MEVKRKFLNAKQEKVKINVLFASNIFLRVRSFVTAKVLINVLRQFFGKRLLREIMTESLFDYKR
jgi:hypothetical protein